MRSKERSRQISQEFLFENPLLLRTYNGVLVRAAPYYEHTFYGLLDDMEAEINAESGIERLHKFIDEMPADVRGRLVGAGFLGYHFGHQLLFGWAESVPAEYDNTEFEDVKCKSFVVDALPRKLRDRLPEPTRALV